MIKNQWYIVLSSKEVREEPVGVTRFGEKLAFWRDTKGVVHCISDVCCHRGASISHGKVKNDFIMCPFHGFEYDSSGTVRLIPAMVKSLPFQRILQ